jgi:hypothetical protein
MAFNYWVSLFFILIFFYWKAPEKIAVEENLAGENIACELRKIGRYSKSLREGPRYIEQADGNVNHLGPIVRETTILKLKSFKRFSLERYLGTHNGRPLILQKGDWSCHGDSIILNFTWGVESPYQVVYIADSLGNLTGENSNLLKEDVEVIEKLRDYFNE